MPVDACGTFKTRNLGTKRLRLRGGRLKCENYMRTVGAEPERSNIYSSKKNENKHIWPETHEKMGIFFGSRDAADALSLAITLCPDTQFEIFSPSKNQEETQLTTRKFTGL
jgi:hypothetical protein